MRIEKVWFDEHYIFIRTDAGHIIGNPLQLFHRLQTATAEQRAHYEISPYGVHWPDIDEDLSLEGFFRYKTDFGVPATDESFSGADRKAA